MGGRSDSDLEEGAARRFAGKLLPHRRRLALAGALLLTLVVALDIVRRRYDVEGIVRSSARDLIAMHTSWWDTPRSQVLAQIDTARALVPATSPPGGAMGPLTVSRDNPRYFEDSEGRPTYLTGSHTWSNFQDNGPGQPPPRFDYDMYLDFLEAHGHNFFRLWVWEGARWTVETRDDDYRFLPEGPFLRTGPGEALDGGLRWDLTRFDEGYFDRLRSRVAEAEARGIYVAVMLFNGWSVGTSKGSVRRRNPWLAHPFHADNNVNGIDGDTDGDGSGEEVHELGEPQVLAIQEAYVRRVIDAVDRFDNVLYEISNESHLASVPWQYHMVWFVRDHRDSKGRRHPVGMTSTFPGGRNEDLFRSPADWISPNRYGNPAPADGDKVIISDTDHIWGIGGDRSWAWRSMTRGLNPIFMDGYDGAGYGVGGAGFDFDDRRWVLLRRNLGYTRHYARRLDLAGALPAPDRCSSGYCMEHLGEGRERFLAYYPPGAEAWIDLSGLVGNFRTEWLDPVTGVVEEGADLRGGERVDVGPPFSEDAVLYVERREG